MCEGKTASGYPAGQAFKTVPVSEAVGMPLAHDITEIRPGEFKGRAFKKGHIIGAGDVCHLQRLGKEKVYVLSISDDEMHEDEAARALAGALAGPGVVFGNEPKEGRLNLLAAHDGLLKINVDALAQFNMLGDVMCATLHANTVVSKGDRIAGTRAIPLVVKRSIIDEAVAIARNGIVEVRAIRKPKAGVVITGNEVFYGRIKDGFAPIIRQKIEQLGGEIRAIKYAPDDVEQIERSIRDCLEAGADLLVTTGGMSVDPDDVTRFAIRKLGAADLTYGSAVLPGAMMLVAYLGGMNGDAIPILGVPACALFHQATVFDLVLPRILAGEKIGKMELARLGHGGLCLNCGECRYPVCPFGK
ncbi:MAG: molybdopterin-binding protein [Candidatus Abyssobacteria bacterium SURF_5]|uniref:Molybdopterin molybdenumtransferase n=1 Tax=Abyssobacteria bacterium (strain SURF_5) TaxID=2093360 RepID=A0A3A4P9W8_ABYX5|nr:MAG: molybdopterin-binding protein [Candidatus Abyssubacteria bacterium SURF_5]